MKYILLDLDTILKKGDEYFNMFTCWEPIPKKSIGKKVKEDDLPVRRISPYHITIDKVHKKTKHKSAK